MICSNNNTKYLKLVRAWKQCTWRVGYQQVKNSGQVLNGILLPKMPFVARNLGEGSDIINLCSRQKHN